MLILNIIALALLNPTCAKIESDNKVFKYWKYICNRKNPNNSLSLHLNRIIR